MSEILRTKCAELWVEGDIVHTRIFEGAEIEVSDLKEVFSASLKLSGGKPYYAITDARNNATTTPEARTYGAKVAPERKRLAQAILVKSVAMKLVVNVYINFNKPYVPTRMFLTEEEALRWFDSLRTKN